MLVQRTTWFVGLLVVALSASSVACASHPLPPRDAAKLVEAPPDDQAVEAVLGLQLSRQQAQAVEALRSKLRDELREAAQARQQLVDDVLAELSRGTLDRAKLSPAVHGFVAASDLAKPQLLAALNELHAILTPEQRASLVDGLGKRKDEGEEDGKRRLKQMLDALDLGVGQQIQLAAKAKERLSGEKANAEQLKKQLQAAGDAFKADPFDASTLELAHGPLVEHWLEVLLSLLGVVAPILDDSQRLTLVAMAGKMLGGSATAP